jgi:hypothetical protein
VWSLSCLWPISSLVRDGGRKVLGYHQTLYISSLYHIAPHSRVKHPLFVPKRISFSIDGKPTSSS